MTGVGQRTQYRQRGGVRIEYVIAAVVCVALLVAMTAVLVSVSNRKSKAELVRRPTMNTDRPIVDTPAPAPTVVAPAPAPTQTRGPSPVPGPAPIPAPVVVAPTPVPVPGGQPVQPGAVEVIVEDAPQVAIAQPQDAPVVIIDAGDNNTSNTRRGAYPDGRPHRIAADAPTRIQAEDFDHGGEKTAYHDTGSSNEGGQYRKNEGVDVESCDDTGSRAAVSHVESGEWLQYTVNVEQSGTYIVRVRASRGISGEGKMQILFGGVDATGDIAISETGGWQSFRSFERDNVELASGEQVMRVQMLSKDININWIEILPASAYVAPVLASDDLETLKIGSRPTGGDWDFGANGGSVSMQSSPQESTKSLRLQDTSRTAGVWALRKFPKQSQQLGFEFRVRYGQAADGFAMGLLGGDKPAILMYTLGGKIVCETSDKDSKSLQTYEANKWYTIRISADVKNKKYNVYVDGVQRGEGLTFRNSVDGIDAWQAEIPNITTGAMYLNALKVTER